MGTFGVACKIFVNELHYFILHRLQKLQITFSKNCKVKIKP